MSYFSFMPFAGVLWHSHELITWYRSSVLSKVPPPPPIVILAPSQKLSRVRPDYGCDRQPWSGSPVAGQAVRYLTFCCGVALGGDLGLLASLAMAACFCCHLCLCNSFITVAAPLWTEPSHNSTLWSSRRTCSRCFVRSVLNDATFSWSSLTCSLASSTILSVTSLWTNCLTGGVAAVGEDCTSGWALTSLENLQNESFLERKDKD